MIDIQVVNHIMLLFLLEWFRDILGYYAVTFAETNQCQHKHRAIPIDSGELKCQSLAEHQDIKCVLLLSRSMSLTCRTRLVASLDLIQ